MLPLYIPYGSLFNLMKTLKTTWLGLGKVMLL